MRNLIDCLIAAAAINHQAEPLHAERDFHPLALHRTLRVTPGSLMSTSPSRVGSYSRRPSVLSSNSGFRTSSGGLACNARPFQNGR